MTDPIACRTCGRPAHTADYTGPGAGTCDDCFRAAVFALTRQLETAPVEARRGDDGMITTQMLRSYFTAVAEHDPDAEVGLARREYDCPVSRAVKFVWEGVITSAGFSPQVGASVQVWRRDRGCESDRIPVTPQVRRFGFLIDRDRAGGRAVSARDALSLLDEIEGAG